jgi:hypothetical protein
MQPNQAPTLSNGVNMKNGWMIRAGNSGRYFDDFEDSKCVGIGWNDLSDLRQYTSAAALGLYPSFRKRQARQNR